MSHLSEVPIERAFKTQPKNLQKQYSIFKKKWLAERDLTRTTEPAFKKAQKLAKAEKAEKKEKAEKAISQDEEGGEELEFKKLDNVRQTL